MAEEQTKLDSYLALNTKVEEDFVSPLTAVRGSLEILRDFPNLDPAEQQRFIETALRSCARLQKGIEELSKAVYAAGDRQQEPAVESDLPGDAAQSHAKRIHFHDDIGAVEIDLTDIVFDSAKAVDDFYDVVEQLVGASGRHWYFLFNYSGCSIWPEAWVAFAHRGKKVNVGYSLGTVRFVENDASEDEGSCDSRQDGFDPDFLGSRQAALEKIEQMKAAST